jgi:hypothetical protein
MIGSSPESERNEGVSFPICLISDSTKKAETKFVSAFFAVRPNRYRISPRRPRAKAQGENA